MSDVQLPLLVVAALSVLALIGWWLWSRANRVPHASPVEPEIAPPLSTRSVLPAPTPPPPRL